MAKPQNKGNREMRKPKMEKSRPPSTQSSPFAARAGAAAAPKAGGKKKLK